jgi:hypothetical protein
MESISLGGYSWDIFPSFFEFAELLFWNLAWPAGVRNIGEAEESWILQALRSLSSVNIREPKSYAWTGQGGGQDRVHIGIAGNFHASITDPASESGSAYASQLAQNLVRNFLILAVISLSFRRDRPFNLNIITC